MLKTREWRGIPFMTGALTEILLSLEDCLDRRVPAFIRVMDAETLTFRLRQGGSVQRESGALINGRLSASLVSHFSASPIRSVDRDFLMYVLLNLAGDNGERVLVLTDNMNGPLGRFKDSQGKDADRIAAVLHREISNCDKALIKTIFQTNAVIVLSDIVTMQDYELYERVAWESGRPLLWIQLPGSLVFGYSVQIVKREGDARTQSIILRPPKWRARVNLAYQILQTQLKPS